MQLNDSNRPKLRDKQRSHNAPYPIGEIPDSVMYAVGKQLVHRHAIGMADITGDDFAGIFAAAIDGEHRDKPLGIADVIWNSCAWSVKTVKHKTPFRAQVIRLISGRNSPVFSAGISDPLEDVKATGRAVLEIWNERVAIAGDQFDDLRMIVLVRNPDRKEYALFDTNIVRYTPIDYAWTLNSRGNLEGLNRTTGKHVFTWQPHGSQFTIIKQIPSSALMFRVVKSPPILEVHQVMNLIEYKDDWIQKVNINKATNEKGGTE